MEIISLIEPLIYVGLVSDSVSDSGRADALLSNAK